jgi:hypothetical protein
MKTIVKYLFIIVFCTFSLSGFAQKKGYVAIASSPPVIDGDIDNVWSESTRNPIPNQINGVTVSAEDLTAYWSALWDDDNLYFLFEVTDNMLVNSGPGASNFWIHDCVEIFFDMLNEKNLVETGSSPTDDKYQYRFIYGLDNEPIPENPPMTGVVNVSKATANGYNIEVKMPWTTLIGSHPFGDVVIGKSIGAEFQVADLDDNPFQWMPDANFTWNNATGVGLKMAANFGTLILVNNNLPDVTPPSAITDLTAEALSAIEVKLNWTSTGDDGLVGLATSYEIRYNTVPVNAANWANSSVVQNVVKPLISGTSQSFIVAGLQGSTTYYFGIKILDEADNASAISNIATATTHAADIIPPAAIVDLQVVTPRPISIELSWTATGDDGNEGAATFYDLRYSQSPITSENWESVAQYNNVPLPQVAGTSQSVIVIGLKPLTKYFFAIKAIDEQNNISAISNVVSATTTELIVTARTPMDQFIGVNAFIDDPIDKILVAGYLREYHNWNWDEGDIWAGGGYLDYPGYPNNEIAFNPSWAAGGNGWFFDKYYKDLTDAGVMVCPAIQGSVRWLNDDKTFPSSDIPVVPGKDPNDPMSFREHANYMYQFAARYGSVEVADNLLKLRANQPRVSGLGYINYLENSNEPDRWWDGPNAQFTPVQLAAMGSADRDGHEGRMGNTYGVKNADPNMKLVMGGLTERALEDNFSYIEGIRQWCLENRTDQEFVYDVINVHHYCGQISPEEANIKGIIQQLVDYRDQYLPDREIWFTEFGWETSIYDTPFTAMEVGDFTREEMQAHYIVREYLLLSSTGIDRAAQYMLRNVENNGRTQHSSSGLTTVKGEWNPKPSWFYVYTMKNTLKGMYYTGEQPSMNTNVMIYKYENASRDTTVYAVWCPTSNGVVVNNYQLSLPNNPLSAKLVKLTDGTIDGNISTLSINRKTVTFDVSERPVFVITTSNFDTSAPGSLIQNDAKKLSGIKLYPSFAYDSIIIDLMENVNTTTTRVQILNVAGEIISVHQSSSQQFGIDVSALKSGMYFAKIQVGDEATVRKFIKQ